MFYKTYVQTKNDFVVHRNVSWFILYFLVNVSLSPPLLQEICQHDKQMHKSLEFFFVKLNNTLSFKKCLNIKPKYGIF